MEQEFLKILRSLKFPHHLRQTHAQIITRGLATSPRLLPALVSATFSLSSPSHAAAVLSTASADATTTVAHNTLIHLLAKLGGRGPEDAITTYAAMRVADVPPNAFTFTFLLRACKSLRILWLCGCIHGQILRYGFGGDTFMQNALLDVYHKCSKPGHVGVARQVFDEMIERDVFSWNSIVGAYISSGDVKGAMELFEAMPERNVVSWNTVVAAFARAGHMASALALFDRIPMRDAISWNLMISGYATGGDVEAARTLFDRMEQKDVVSWTAMVSAYAKIGNLDSAQELFDQMPVKSLVSWNAMIAGYNHNSRYDEALCTFKLMMLEGRFRPDEATLVSVVSACAQLGSDEYCNWVDSFIRKNNSYITVPLGNALIYMFAKCGYVERAQLVFSKMRKKCIITWTTMISAFAHNGLCRKALLVYNDMCTEGVEPDDTVFSVVLAACSHRGFLHEGWSIFQQMVGQHGIKPRMEHYGRIVVLLGRAGKLREAVQFIEGMPLKPSVVIWFTLLSSCIAHGHAELIEYVSKKIAEIEPFDSSYHQVLVSYCSSLKGRWDSAMDARTIMHKFGIGENVPGRSSIQVGSEVHEFFSKDTMHQQSEEIYETVDGLTDLIRQTESAPWPS